MVVGSSPSDGAAIAAVHARLHAGAVRLVAVLHHEQEQNTARKIAARMAELILYSFSIDESIGGPTAVILFHLG